VNLTASVSNHWCAMWIFLLCWLVFSVCDIIFDSKELRGHFHLTTEEVSKRSVYSDGENYLFFKVIDGVPKWIISDSLEDGGQIVAQVSSWAFNPVDIQVVSPFSEWVIDDYGDEVKVEAKWVKSRCGDFDESVHVSTTKNPTVNGFYQAKLTKVNKHPYYQNGDLYLFYKESSQRYERWMISHDLGKETGLAYIDHAKSTPHATEGDWQCFTNGGWQADSSFEFTRSMFERSSFRSLFYKRQYKLDKIADSVESFTLRNEVSIPKIQIMGTKTKQMFDFRVAMTNKYKFFHVSQKQIQMLQQAVSHKHVLFTSLVLRKTHGRKEILKALEVLGRSSFECIIVDLEKATEAEMFASWAVIEQIYAEGLMVSAGLKLSRFELIKKLVSNTALPPHLILLEDIDQPLQEYKALSDEYEFVMSVDASMQGKKFETIKTKLAANQNLKGLSPLMKQAAWLLSQDVGVWLDLKSKLIDAEYIVKLQAKIEEQEDLKDEL